MSKILITGGAGFIGTKLANHLSAKGCVVTVMDNLNPQIHGKKPDLQLGNKVRFFKGDVTNKNDFYSALRGQDYVAHLAAETGTGQSMYQTLKYVKTNIVGTAHLCDYLVNERHNVRKVLLTSSRAIYGEGKYSCSSCGDVFPDMRSAAGMSGFDPVCPKCHRKGGATAVPTDENAVLHPSSQYGVTKRVQEDLLLTCSKSAGVPIAVVRYQNVFGPGQSLRNPYTGILSIFSQLARKNREIEIFEDGMESRDFIYIDDVVECTAKCILSKTKDTFIVNVGSGVATTVKDAAKMIVNYLHSSARIHISGRFREGDIRHSVADISRCRNIFGFKPKVDFSKGLGLFLDWAATQPVVDIRAKYKKSLHEMQAKGLLCK